VTAGPTREAIDAARFLSNPSSGKMGYALAAEAFARGADVTLISGPTHLASPSGVHLVRVVSANEMFNAALNQAQGADLILKAAAVADYRPEQRSRGKVKKETLRRKLARGGTGDRTISLRLVQTPDILEEIGRRKKPGQVLVGFAAETGDLESNAQKKLLRKNLDMIVANRIGGEGEGFEADTNRAIVMDRDGHRTDLPLMSKTEMARVLLDLASRMLPGRVTTGDQGRRDAR
jgi:phosphopantothenoylcysteine decarboxylase / phosphopantothenate---cysteine ligase